PLTNPVHVGTTDANDSESTIAMNDSGQFVIAWTHKSGNTTTVAAQRYNADGTPRGGVSTYSGSNYSEPSVGMDTAGDYAIAFTDQASNGHRTVKGWINRISGPDFSFAVTTGTHNTYQPSVAMNAAGNFVVAYTYDYSATDQDVHVQRFNAS